MGSESAVRSASRVHQSDWCLNGIRFLRSSDLVAMNKGKKIRQKLYISNELFTKLSDQTGYPKSNDVLITGGGSIGIPYLIKDSAPIYFKDADILWIQNSSNNVNGAFLFAFFESEIFKRYLSSIAHVGTISHYTIIQLKNTSLKVPRIEEQNRIGKYFKSIDRLIAANEDKHKNALNIRRRFITSILS